MEDFDQKALKKQEDDNLTPSGELALRVLAMPKDTNASGDIFGGWLVSQMDMAAEATALRVAKGRIVTMAIEQMSFISPVKVGSSVCCYTQVTAIGHSSIRVAVEVWTYNPQEESSRRKVTETAFVFVAVDDDGHIRAIDAS